MKHENPIAQVCKENLHTQIEEYDILAVIYIILKYFEFNKY